jgi:hypothetical protein
MYDQNFQPNNNYFEYERVVGELSENEKRDMKNVICKFFDFIFDIEVKISLGFVEEEVLKVYFERDIQGILLKNIIIDISSSRSGWRCDEDKKLKVVALSNRWYGYNFLELDGGQQ